MRRSQNIASGLREVTQVLAEAGHGLGQGQAGVISSFEERFCSHAHPPFLLVR